MLGFSSDRTYGGRDIHVAEHPVSIYANLHLVYVYCELLEQVLVGDTKAPLLRIIDRSPPEKSNVTHVTFNPCNSFRCRKSNGDLAADSTSAPVNLLLHSMFSQVDVSLNGTLSI